jgi:hypothetical protein
MRFLVHLIHHLLHTQADVDTPLVSIDVGWSRLLDLDCSCFGLRLIYMLLGVVYRKLGHSLGV